MSSILSLNGDWDFIWDAENEGLHNRWFVNIPNDVQKAQVPHVWEQNFKKTEQVAFYFKKIFIDSAEKSRRIFLKFENVTIHASVWLNGAHLGSHFGGHSSFLLDASKSVKVGEENMLCVRVSTVNSYGKIDISRTTEDDENTRFALADELPVGLPWSQYPFAGINGNVDLILGKRAFIESCNIIPDADQERITVDLKFINPRNFSANLLFVVVNPNGEAYKLSKKIKLDKENNNTKIPLEFKDIHWWSPENPNLYQIEVCLEDSFSVVRNFGFRKFDSIKGDYYLNDKVVKIKGLVYNQHDQSGGLWTDNLEQARQDFIEIKRLGFDFIKSGGTPFSSKILDLCDEIGLMVFQEMPIHNQKASSQGLEKARTAIEEVVLSSKSHPSVAAWVLGSENGTLMLENGTKLLKGIEDLDQAHPAFSNLNSVYIDNQQQYYEDMGKVLGVTNHTINLYSTHRLHLRTHLSQSMSQFLTIYGDKENSDAEIPDITFGDGEFQEKYSTFANSMHQKILVSLKNNDLLHDLSKVSSKLKGLRAESNSKDLARLYKKIQAYIKTGTGKTIWSSPADFIAELNQMALVGKLDQITALQSNPRVSGFFLDQWADYGTNLSGLTNEFRASKGLDWFAQEITSDDRVLISGLERVCKPQSEISFNLALMNESRFENCEISISLLDSKEKKISQVKIPVSPETSLTSLGMQTLNSPAKTGSYTLRTELIYKKDIVLVQNEPILCIDTPEYDFAPAVCFLDEAENSKSAIKLILGEEPIIFTSSLSSWNEDILARLAVAVRGGKTLLVADINQEDVEAFNSCQNFGFQIDAHYSSGSSGISAHFFADKALAKAAHCETIMGQIAATIMPSMSMAELEGAKIYAHSVTINEGELIEGADVQSYALDQGKIVFCQYNLLDNVENNVLAEQMFAHVIKNICK